MDKLQMDSKLLSVNELCAYLGRSKASIYSMVNRGQLPYIKLGNGRNGAIRFDSAEIQNLITSRKVSALPKV